ncbi:CAP domain-containing protein [Candidatus Peregrinibacteria bacterium]|nr:CAP domain-containing protein [Candidatus Peregrinibacteria bacterium]
MQTKNIFWRAAAVLAIMGIFFLPSAFAKSSNTPKFVSKKTFAKQLAVAINLPPGKKEKCYKDLKKSDSATPFICALKKAGVFSSKTKKFSPTAKTTWKFAVTSICKAKNWTVKKTWKACSTYAKKHGFPENFPENTKTKIPKGKLAQLVNIEAGAPKNTATVLPEPITEITSDEIPPRAAASLDFTPNPEGTIGTNFFANIVLSAPMPNRFYKDEVYFVDGDLINATDDEVFAFLCRANQGCDESINFIEKVDGRHFRIPVIFRETGNFQIGIIPGRSGQSRVENISVLPEFTAPTATGTAPTNISIGYQKGNTVFHWNGQGSLTHLLIYQGEKRVDYFFRQQPSSFTIPSADFADFKKGSAGWLIEHDGAGSEPQIMTVTVQDLRKIEDDSIEVLSMPEVLPTPGKFTFSGKAKKPVAKKIAVTLPNGKVEEFSANDKDFSEGQSIAFEKDFSETGTYIFEVNNPEGSAVVNVPIYVGTAIPLIPDYFALNEPELDPSLLTDLSKARTKLLELINADRAENGLTAVSLAGDLNSIAQNHARNMVNLNFFGHVDPAGNSPDDRRKKAGITTPIRENLGKASSLELVEFGLMRSPIHRAAIIDPEMKRVGLGIVKNSEGYYFVTQNFADMPLLASDLPNLENELFTAANSQRTASNLSALSHDSLLRSSAQNWSKQMVSENFFGVSSPSGQKLIDTLRNQGIDTSIQSYIVEVGQKTQLEPEILKQGGLKESANLKIGIGLAINSAGEIFATVIYTP